MSAKIIDGRIVAQTRRQDLKNRVADLQERGTVPGLAMVLVGENPASKTYAMSKAKVCKDIGIQSEQYNLREDVEEEEILSLIEKLNCDENIHGILVELPLPEHLSVKRIVNAIVPHKDVDAFNYRNIGAMVVGDYSYISCTPAGIMELLKYYNIDVCAKDCVIIGRSNIVGKPLALLMLNLNATVTICHSRTENLASYCKKADILIAAVGIPKFVTVDMIKPGAVVIDVGVHPDENGGLCGDVDFESARDLAGYITPVPGGVGPMTTTMLMSNTIMAAETLNDSM